MYELNMYFSIASLVAHSPLTSEVVLSKSLCYVRFYVVLSLIVFLLSI
jgi:hypothetical protein